MRLLLPILCILSLAAPAQAGRDEEVALSGVLQQAHDHLDDGWLRRMMAPEELRRFDDEGGGAQFRRHRQAYGVSHLVSCAEGLPEPGSRLPAPDGDLLAPLLFRCEIACQHGAYSALITLGPADPLVRPSPRPGRIERLFIASPLLDRAPWPWFARDDAAPWLAAIWAVALLSLAWGALRLSGRGPFAWRPIPHVPSLLLWRAGHEVVLVLRLLAVLLLVFLGGPLWWQLGPAPLWGVAAMLLGLLGLVAFSVGLLLAALGGYFRPRGGRAFAGALAAALLMLVVPSALALRTSFADLTDLIGAGEAEELPGGYRLPLRAGPAYVRHGGPLLDLVYRHKGGLSCRGRAPESCKIFGAEVLAPDDGVVVEAVDRYSDQPIGGRDRVHMMGNYVLIDQGRQHQRERSLLTHLMRGSVAVRPGQALRRGDVIGRVGNSGDSDEPHLSLELLAKAQTLPGRRPPLFCGAAEVAERGAGIPVVLGGYRSLGIFNGSIGRRTVERGAPSCGQRIEPAAP